MFFLLHSIFELADSDVAPGLNWIISLLSFPIFVPNVFIEKDGREERGTQYKFILAAPCVIRREEEGGPPFDVRVARSAHSAIFSAR